MSYQAVAEANKSEVPPVSTSCDEILNEVPGKISRIMLSGFAPGKELACWDNDADEEWDSLCVPLFPRKNLKISNGYSAVLVYFNGVKDRDSLNEILKSDELETDFWPLRQELDVATHSMLAQKYANLDFSRSPVLHYGYSAGNPVLGKTSLTISAALGSLSLMGAFLSFVVGFFMKKPKRKISFDDEGYDDDDDKPVTNRAGLPIGGSSQGSSSSTTSIFDQVTSLRDQEEVEEPLVGNS